jgi:hypothetical protein
MANKVYLYNIQIGTKSSNNKLSLSSENDHENIILNITNVFNIKP